MAHVTDVTVMFGNGRPMSEGFALGRVGSLCGKKTHRFADSYVVSGGSDDLRIMVGGCCQPSFSPTINFQREQKVLDPFSNEMCISDPSYLSKRVKSQTGGSVTSSAGYSGSVDK